jgi:type IV secretory pathway VirB6-like protein
MGKASRHFVWIMAAMVIAMASMLVVTNAHARATFTETTAELSTVDADGGTIACTDIPVRKPDGSMATLGEAALLGKIMPCLAFTIQSSTIRFTKEMVDLFQPIMYSFLALVVVLYGIRVLQNEPEIYKQGFLLVVQITLVVAILNDLGSVNSITNVPGESYLIPAVYQIMNETLTIVTASIGTTEVTCDIAKYANESSLVLWQVMDCVTGKLFGFAMPEPGANGKAGMLLQSSMFGLATGFLFGGAWGVAIFFGLIGVLVSLFMMIVRTAAVFISSYLTICFMIILSPLLMPLVFLKGTHAYFNKFWGIIISAFITPIILTAYVMFALIIYDKMLFAVADPSATPPREAAILTKLFEVDVVKSALESSRTLFDMKVTGDADEAIGGRDVAAADKRAAMRNPLMQNPIMGALSGATGITFRADAVNMAKLGEDFNKGKESIKRMFNELATLIILAWLINEGLKVIPQITSQLTIASASLGMAARSLSSKTDEVMASLDKAKAGATASYVTKDSEGRPNGTMSGADFIRQTPTAGKNAVLEAFKRR